MWMMCYGSMAFSITQKQTYDMSLKKMTNSGSSWTLMLNPVGLKFVQIKDTQ